MTEGRRPDGSDSPAQPFSAILCAVDGSEGGYAAVEQAAALTGPGGGRLTLLEVTSFRVEGEHRSPVVNPLRAKGIVDRAVEIAGEAGVDWRVEVDPASPPARVILDWAQDHDMLAMGAPSISWFGGMFTASATDEAMGRLTAPLLSARPVSPEQRSLPPRMMVASDGLEGSDELVEFASRLAGSQSCPLTLMHATRHVSHRRRECVRSQGRRLLESLGDSADVVFDAGSPRTAIVEAAQSMQASMIVMSSRRRDGLQTIGSVSRKVVHNGHCTVLLVPPEHLQP